MHVTILNIHLAMSSYLDSEAQKHNYYIECMGDRRILEVTLTSRGQLVTGMRKTKTGLGWGGAVPGSLYLKGTAGMCYFSCSG